MNQGSKKLRAAVVGVGYLGNFHAQKYKSLSEKPEMNVELIGVCDLNKPQVEKVAQELNVKAFYQVEELIGHIDVVTIATITPVHYKLSKFFLENGVHVNVEKPIALTTKEANELVEIANKQDLVLCVGHSERFNPAYKELKNKIHSPKYVEFNRNAPFKLRGSDVSVLHDLMIHDLDLMLHLDSSRCRLKTATAGRLATATYDWCSASFEFASGLQVHINSSRLAKEMVRNIKVIDQKNIWQANLQTGELEQGSLTENPEAPMSYQTQVVGRGDNLLSETEAFLQLIQGKGATAVTGQDGARALLLVEEIIALIESRAEVC